MKKKKRWFYILIIIIIFLSSLLIFLNIWFYKMIKKPSQSQEKEMNQMISHILPQLNYYNHEINIQNLTKEEQLWFGLKITYHLPHTTKITIIQNNQKQIQIPFEEVQKTLKQYFNISLNNENQSLPYFITYNSFNDSYLISNIETFGNYQTDFHYQIIKQKKFMNKNIITVKSTSQNEENIYEVQFICNKSCYFVSSKIIK